ncbi:MAG: hypothetical protein QOG54_767 [Actinomycetota bacterium]|jgi:hypothetical protein|nr:hypothetical protein [Actinomycetota bacterium]
MPKKPLRHYYKATIDVQTPPAVPFDVVAGNLEKPVEKPDSWQTLKPLVEGPVRRGFKYRQTIVHNRNQCYSDWEITQAERPTVIEQTLSHHCMEAQGRVLTGGERWEFLPNGDGTTLVSLTSWTDLQGFNGWLQKFFGPKQESREFTLRKRLAYTQFEAERRAKLEGQDHVTQKT